MELRCDKPGLAVWVLALVVTAGACPLLRSQATVSNGLATQGQGKNPVVPSGEGVLVDQVVAVVNGDLILESDVDEDRRFQAFQPFSNPENSFNRQEAVQRLIDRSLILQQAKLQPDDAATKEQAIEELNRLRKEIPACREYHCETDAGWAKFVEAQGFTVDELTEHWRQRMEVLKFVEVRFRMGIRISSQEVKDYYIKTLLPAYAKRKAAAPSLEALSGRIQEILLQQQVSNLLADWLRALRAQGTVRVMTPGGVPS